EEIDIFSGPDDSIPPGIESDFDSEEDIIDNLLNDDPIPEYERLTFDMEPDVPVINNVDKLNEDECFDLGGGGINVEVDDSFIFDIQTFLPYITYHELNVSWNFALPLVSSPRTNEFGDRVKLCDSVTKNKVLRGRHPMLILLSINPKFSKDSRVRCFIPGNSKIDDMASDASEYYLPTQVKRRRALNAPLVWENPQGMTRGTIKEKQPKNDLEFELKVSAKELHEHRQSRKATFGNPCAHNIVNPTAPNQGSNDDEKIQGQIKGIEKAG
ncbi:hypothetical protein Tco_0915087, partial [Tanacetum coccineum]